MASQETLLSSPVGNPESTRRPLTSTLHTARTLLIVSVAYYLGAQAAFAVGTLSDRIFAPFWPPNIVLFCALTLAPKRQWWLYIAATFPAHVLAEIAVGMPAAQLLVAFATNCAVALINAFAVRRYLKQPPWFSTLKNVSIYLAIAAGVAPGISALGGAFVQILGGGSMASYWTYWGNWYMSNVLGSVTLAPVCLVSLDRRSWVGRLNSGRTLEAGVIALGLAVVCAIVFHAGSGTVTSGFLPAIIYAPIPLLIWAAVRFGQRGASGAILVLTVVSIWQNLHESSVFTGTTRDGNVLALQVFLLGVAIPLFFLGAVIDERKQAAEEMRALAGQLLHVQDEERRRIARELHDSTGQNLAVAGLLMSRVQKTAPTSVAPVVTEVHEILQKAMADIRSVSYLLHPPFLNGVGLDSALRSYLDGFTKRSGLHVDLNVPVDLERMPSSIEIALFRVVQEALSNVWRHSGSDRAQIHLEQSRTSSERGVILSIEDFGKGIPEDVRQATLSTKTTKHQAETGLGLLSMRERLHQIGGALEIHSKFGHTIIRATVKSIPLQPTE